MQNGISIGTGNEIYIKNTYIRNNSNIGVYITGGAGLVNAVIEKTTVENQLTAWLPERIAGSLLAGACIQAILVPGFWRREVARPLKSMLITAS